MKRPCNEEVKSQRATLMSPALMAPKLAVSEGETSSPATWVPMSWKSISRPRSFSTIWGWAEVMRKLRACPKPSLRTMTPRA